MHSAHALHTVFLGAGSNIGERHRNLARACRMLDDLHGTTVTGVSPVYLSEPVGYTDQEWFCNAVFHLETELSPEALLEACKRVEISLGRPSDHPRWGPRVIDLDILLYDDLVLHTDTLAIPHRDMHKRKFVLIPLLDLADPIHPGRQKRARTLLEECGDTSRIVRSERNIEC